MYTYVVVQVKYTKHFYRQEGLLLELTRKVEMEGEI
jgi:hypothetical protein